MNWVEVVGWAGATLVVTSLALTSVVRIRLLCLLGGLAFTAYGVLVGAWPVAAANAAVAALSLLHLVRELSRRTDLAAVAIEPAAPFLVDFLGSHAFEIQNSQPDYHPSPRDTFVRLLTRDGLPAGVLIGEPAGRELLVKLDYVTPAFRDSRIARWLFGPGRSTFTDAGFTRLVATAHTSVHRNYLEMLGFRREASAYVLDLR